MPFTPNESEIGFKILYASELSPKATVVILNLAVMSLDYKMEFIAFFGKGANPSDKKQQWNK